MSVTLKLADEDAAVIGSILKAVSEDIQPADSELGKFKNYFYRIRSSHSGRTPEKILELAGAFKVAVRANER